MSKGLCAAGSLFGSAAEAQHQECASCYVISLESVTAFIACDLILTIVITVSIFCLAARLRRRGQCACRKDDNKNAQTLSKKMPAEVSESPYQELHGVQSDVYSELRHFSK